MEAQIEVDVRCSVVVFRDETVRQDEPPQPLDTSHNP
jgi:hypothetical protein